MSATPSRELILLLQDIEARSLRQGEVMPQQNAAMGLWEGILFGVCGASLLAPVGDVKELINFPSTLTKVPGTQNWVRGVANIRGVLLPIIDLQSYLGGETIATTKRSRVLVIDHQGLHAGLLVANVYGLRYFRGDQSCEPPPLPASIRPYAQRAFNMDEDTWAVFEIRALAESAEFQFAAA